MKWIIVSFAVILGIAVLLFAGLWFLGGRVAHPWPVERKLADITADRVEAAVTWPNTEARFVFLVVGLPQDPLALSRIPRPCPEFRAQVTILTAQGEVVQTFDLAPADTEQCNWLTHEHGLDAFILTSRQEKDVLQSCRPGETYTIRLDFTTRPIEFTSLWLSYLEFRQ